MAVHFFHGFLPQMVSYAKYILMADLSFARYEVLIRKSVNLNIPISFYKGFKNGMTYRPSKIFNEEVT